jgi:hypothetical protein
VAAAIHIDPKFALAYYDLAVLKVNNSSDIRGILDDLNRAIQPDPHLPVAERMGRKGKYFRILTSPG